MGFKFIEWSIELINSVCVVGLVLSFVVTAVVTHLINYLKSNLDISLTRKSAILIQSSLSILVFGYLVSEILRSF